MGAEKSITYAVPVTQKLPGESAIYRYPDFRDKLFDRFEDNLRTMKDVLINSATKFANSPCLGKPQLMQEPSLPGTIRVRSSISPIGRHFSRLMPLAVPSTLRSCSISQRERS